jgi:hypothetical protein
VKQVNLRMIKEVFYCCDLDEVVIDDSFGEEVWKDYACSVQ